MARRVIVFEPAVSRRVDRDVVEPVAVEVPGGGHRRAERVREEQRRARQRDPRVAECRELHVARAAGAEHDVRAARLVQHGLVSGTRGGSADDDVREAVPVDVARAGDRDPGQRADVRVVAGARADHREAARAEVRKVDLLAGPDRPEHDVGRAVAAIGTGLCSSCADDDVGVAVAVDVPGDRDRASGVLLAPGTDDPRERQLDRGGGRGGGPARGDDEQRGEPRGSRGPRQRTSPDRRCLSSPGSARPHAP